MELTDMHNSVMNSRNTNLMNQFMLDWNLANLIGVYYPAPVTEQIISSIGNATISVGHPGDSSFLAKIRNPISTDFSNIQSNIASFDPFVFFKPVIYPAS